MYHAPRGTSDILPEEQPFWRYVESKAVGRCQLYGYQRIETPTFEDTHLFARSVGAGTDIVEKEMYTFDDRGGNSLTLRPEGTASICRAYIEHGMYNLTQPVRLYYMANIFRYERPQAGRYREHHQFGCEAIGEAAPSVDAEIIGLAWQTFQSMGLLEIALYLNSIGCRECRPSYLEVLKQYYAQHAENLCNDCKVRLEKNPLRLLDCKQPSCQPVADAAPRSIDYLCPECKKHFDLLLTELGLLGIPYRINHRLVRGLDYYTRTVFEIQPAIEGGQSALGGGGRYDGLIEELGGRPTPAVGFAAGIERIIMNLKRANIPVPPLPGPRVFLAHIGAEAGNEAVKLSASLRKAGIGIILGMGEKSLKAQLRQANSLGLAFTVILGEDELKAGQAVLRDMARAEQENVPLAELPVVLGQQLEVERSRSAVK